MKDIAKKQITRVLERQAKRLLKKYQPKVIAVVGSVGKTSTKLAIAHVLSGEYKTLVHQGNYNSEIGLPLSLFNIEVPKNIMSLGAWNRVIKKTNAVIKNGYPYQVVVLELGTDKPGDIGHFMRYIKPDIAVITAVSAEHMEFFKTLDAVAKEELAITQVATKSLYSRGDVNPSYIKKYSHGDLHSFDNNQNADYGFARTNYQFGKGFNGTLKLGSGAIDNVSLNMVGEHNLKAAVAAASVADMLGMAGSDVKKQLESLQPVSGRMQLLAGKNGSLIIDDTYNASPLAVKAALDTLYGLPKTAKKIAMLGSMNELGSTSPKSHRAIGAYCNNQQLDLVVTIGRESAEYLAPTAEAGGCKVVSFLSPYAAGKYVAKILQKNDVVLAKGSQNGVFAEEAVALLLANEKDKAKLVRQGAKWRALKAKQFHTKV